MKTLKALSVLVCILAYNATVMGQGLVNFFNNSVTLVSAGGVPTVPTAGAFYFGLFTAPLGTTDYDLFTFRVSMARIRRLLVVSVVVVIILLLVGLLEHPVRSTFSVGRRNSVLILSWSFPACALTSRLFLRLVAVPSSAPVPLVDLMEYTPFQT